jgi:hypothetical protein
MKIIIFAILFEATVGLNITAVEWNVLNLFFTSTGVYFLCDHSSRVPIQVATHQFVYQ